ncbi:hypothetical protein V6N12_039725 [Hibiscus sabdariffa]
MKAKRPSFREHGVPVCRQLPQQAQQQPLGNVEPTPRCYTRQHQKFESSGTSKSTNKSLQMLSTIIHPRLQCQSRPAPLVKSKRQTQLNHPFDNIYLFILIFNFFAFFFKELLSLDSIAPLRIEIGFLLKEGESNMQSQLVCSGCRSILLYPRGATNVCCALCNTVTQVPSPGMEMAQLICGGCRTLLMYTRGATSVRCSCCNTVNLATAPSNQMAHINCGHCRTTLMYPYGAQSVKCAVCQYVTNVGMGNVRVPLPASRPNATGTTSTSTSQTVVVENPMSVDESGKLVSNVVVGQLVVHIVLRMEIVNICPLSVSVSMVMNHDEDIRFEFFTSILKSQGASRNKMQASDRFNINSQLEHLQAKYVGTGHADLNRFEWAVNIQRDSYASYIGHYPMLAYFAVAENESIGRERYNFMQKMLLPCGLPPEREDD